MDWKGLLLSKTRKLIFFQAQLTIWMYNFGFESGSGGGKESIIGKFFAWETNTGGHQNVFFCYSNANTNALCFSQMFSFERSSNSIVAPTQNRFRKSIKSRWSSLHLLYVQLSWWHRIASSIAHIALWKILYFPPKIFDFLLSVRSWALFMSLKGPLFFHLFDVSSFFNHLIKLL